MAQDHEDPTTPTGRLLDAVRAGLAGGTASLPAHREAVLSLAGDHRVLPLVAAALPDDEKLAGHHRAVAGVALRIGRTLVDLLEAFEGRGIRAIPYKGPVLAAELYGDPAGRQYEDLDLLVPPGDATAAVEALEERECAPELSLSPTERRGVVRHAHSLHFGCEDVTVDLQWRVSPSWYPVDLDVAALAERAGTTRIHGREVPSLAPADRVVALCAHGCKHRWGRLGWVADVAASLPEADPDRLLARARAARCRRRVLVGAALAADLLGAALPERVRDATGEDPAARRLAAGAREALFEGTPGGPPVPSLGVTPFHLRSLDARADRVRYVTRLAFSPGPADVRLVPDGEALAPLRYLVRPPRLAVDAGRRVVRRSR